MYCITLYGNRNCMYCIDCATYVLCLVRHIRIVSMTVNDKDYLVGQNEILVILVPKNKGYLVGRNENLQNEILVTLVPQGKDPSSVDVVHHERGGGGGGGGLFLLTAYNK